MNTGVIVLAHRKAPEVEPVAGWYADRLRERGRRNVRVAYHEGSPSVEEVLRDIRVPGTNNTVVVLPLLLSEGDISTWLMPKGMGMPDNCCSFTYITGTHIAIRFSTAFGKMEALSEVLMHRMSEAGAEKDDGILLIGRGSRLDMCMDTVRHHADCIRDRGFCNVEYNTLKHSDRSIRESVASLKEKGVKRIVVLPMFLFEGRSVKDIIPDLVNEASEGIPVICARCIGCDDILLDDMDRKIPEDW